MEGRRSLCLIKQIFGWPASQIVLPVAIPLCICLFFADKSAKKSANIWFPLKLINPVFCVLNFDSPWKLFPQGCGTVRRGKDGKNVGENCLFPIIFCFPIIFFSGLLRPWQRSKGHKSLQHQACEAWDDNMGFSTHTFPPQKFNCRKNNNEHRILAFMRNTLALYFLVCILSELFNVYVEALITWPISKPRGCFLTPIQQSWAISLLSHLVKYGSPLCPFPLQLAPVKVRPPCGPPLTTGCGIDTSGACGRVLRAWQPLFSPG